MKRLISTALIVLLLFTALAGCGEESQTCFSALKKAMRDCNTLEFELLEDMKMELGGILINSRKESFTLDGKGHTIFDCASDSFEDAIQIQAGALKTLTIRDVTIVGENTAGFLVSLLGAGVQIILENVVYSGPNLVINEGGTVLLKNCRAELKGKLGCASRFTFEGKNSIVRISGSEEILKIVTLEDEICGITVWNSAEVRVTDAGSGAFAYFSGTGCEFSILPKALFDYVGGILTDGDALHSFIADKDTEVTAEINRSLQKPMITLLGTMIVSERSRLRLIARENNENVPVVHLLGDLESNLVFSDPLEVLLFNHGPAIACKSGGQMNWYVQCIHMWDKEHQPEHDALTNPHKEYAVNSTDRFTLITDINADGRAVNLKTEAYNSNNPLNENTFSFIDIHVLHITRTNESSGVIPNDDIPATPDTHNPAPSKPSNPHNPSKPHKPSRPAEETGSLFSFFVIDTAGHPLPGAEFVLAQNGRGLYSACSDTDGIVLFEHVKAGTYTMFETISPPGFPPESTTHTVVVSNTCVTVDGMPVSQFFVVNPTVVQSAPPAVDTVRQAASVITGRGVPGSEIRVDYFGMQTLEWFATVSASGIWFITVPQSVTLISGATIFAYQSEIGMIESQPNILSVVN